MATTSNMFMYSLTLQKQTSCNQAILGNFFGTKQQQVLTAQGSRLVLYELSRKEVTIREILSQDTFSIIRGIAAYKVSGSPKDHLLVSADTGRIAILEYNPDKNRFEQKHLETFGKSGVRRVIPGHYLAADPGGRACLIASLEKNKIAYLLNRNPSGELTISSPLEANKAKTMVFAMVAIDNGWLNPIFAAIELDYEDIATDPSEYAMQNTEKYLVYYEVDLGVNHVVRKWAVPIHRTANFLLPLPGGDKGPGGVLVGCEGFVEFRHNTYKGELLRIPIPRRRAATEDPERLRHVVCAATHRTKDIFFCLIQTEDGDLFKVSIHTKDHPDGFIEVKKLGISYFQTIPVATEILIHRFGVVFVVHEAGNHGLYALKSLGDDDDQWTSSQFLGTDPSEIGPAFFHPEETEHMGLTHSVPSMAPLMKSKVVTLKEIDSTPKIYTVSGQGSRSTFRSLTHGLELNELQHGPLGSPPKGIWTLKKHIDDQYDSYIILSHTDATITLAIEGQNVVESDTDFKGDTNTLLVQLVGEHTLVQVHPRGIRQIRGVEDVHDWEAPRYRTIVAATANSAQVVVALSSGEIVYLSVDEEGYLAEFSETATMSGTVTCLNIDDVPEGRLRSPYLAVGCDDATVRILGLEDGEELETKSVQALSSSPTSLCLTPMLDASSGQQIPHLHIGLMSGVYLRTVLDEISGELTDTRMRFLGARAVRLSRVFVDDQNCVVALSTRPHLIYTDRNSRTIMMSPLNVAPLDMAWGLHTEHVNNGMVTVAGRDLYVYEFRDIGQNTIQKTIPLRYTPRDFTQYPEQPIFFVIQSDNNVLSAENTARLQNDTTMQNGDSAPLDPAIFGYPRARGHWASCIQVVNPVLEEVLCTVELDGNEAALCATTVHFDSQGETLLVVGVGKDIKHLPYSHTCGYVNVYKPSEDFSTLKLVHKTQLSSPPRALLPFHGRVLVGWGKNITWFDMGLKQLLKKAQAFNIVPTQISGLEGMNNRIIVSDVTESVTYLAFKRRVPPPPNRPNDPPSDKFIPFCDDTIPRWMTCGVLIDYETFAGGDKFGNIFFLRCPEEVSRDAEEDTVAAHLLHDRPYLGGTANRVQLVIQNYTADIPTSIHKSTLMGDNQRELLIWTGLHGTIGAMVPFISRDDVDFFQTLEAQLRLESPSISGRNHLAYRSYYAPVKGCIDGDLCESFAMLDANLKAKVAGQLERSVREVERKIAEMRTRVAF